MQSKKGLLPHTAFFPPIKVKIPKKKAKGTPFRSDRKLKIVLPCQRDKNNNDNIIIPAPYEFNFCGLVNPKYAFVPDWLNKQTGIEHVTQRVYRGHKRPEGSCTLVRDEFLAKKDEIMALAARMENHFKEPMMYQTAVEYLDEFYSILTNPKMYDRLILTEASLEEE